MTSPIEIDAIVQQLLTGHINCLRCAGEGPFSIDSEEALVYLTPTLGPTATLLLFRLGRTMRHSAFAAIDVPELAQELGVGRRVEGPNAPIVRAFQRLAMFGFIHQAPDGRLMVPLLSRGLKPSEIIRLPAYLRDTAPRR